MDAFVRVSLVGIELLTVDLRIVIASVDTYLRYAEGVERLQVYTRSGAKKLPDLVGGGMRTHALKKGAEKLKDAVTGDDDDESDEGDEGDEGGEEGEEGEQEERFRGREASRKDGNAGRAKSGSRR